MISSADKKAIDEAVHTLHYVSRDENGSSYIEIFADYRDSNEGLLAPAYEKRRLGFEDKDNPQFALSDYLRETIWEWHLDSIGQMEHEILEKAGFDPSDEQWDLCMDYLRETYPIQPDYDHFLDQDMCVNIMLEYGDEGNRDFGGIAEQYEAMIRDLTPEERSASLSEENGLSWLVKQQGHTMEELAETLDAYHAFWSSDEAEALSGYDERYQTFCSNHNLFLSSVCQELVNMVNIMNTMTVLTRISLNEFAEFMQPGKEIVLPKNSMVGIFNPWNGGGSTLDIMLEQDLVLPSDLVYDIQIEGVKPFYQYTVDNVYGLVGNAWVKAEAVRDTPPVPVPTRPDLDSLIVSAKQRSLNPAERTSQASEKIIDAHEQGRD